MSSSNFIRIGGRLVRQPELKYTATGIPLCKFTLAINHSKDKTSFIDCNAWNEIGVMISQKKNKGDYLKISGTIQQETWKNTSGQNRSKISVTANEIIVVFLEKKQPSQTAQNINNAFDGQQVDNSMNDMAAEDIPF